MTDHELYDTFDDCLTRMSAGESLEDCLRRHPSLAGELRLMLEAARLTLWASRVPHHIQVRSRARFLAAAAQLRAGAGVNPARTPPAKLNPLAALLRRTLTTAVAVLAGFILGTAGLYYASASTIPGDTLYGVKRAFESTRIQLASDPAARFALEEKYNGRREVEAEAILAQDRTATVNFGGLLVARGDTRWQIGGFNVLLTPQTKISGDPQPGYYVDVVAESNAGMLTALQLAITDAEITGELARSSGRWAVSGTRFAITPETLVTGELAPGATATVRIRMLHSGELVALSVTALAPTTAAPAEASTAQPKPTRQLAATPEPSRTSEVEQASPLPPTAAPAPQPEPAQVITSTVEKGDDSGNNNFGDDGGNSNSNSNSNVSSHSGGDNANDDSGDSGSGGSDSNSNSNSNSNSDSNENSNSGGEDGN